MLLCIAGGSSFSVALRSDGPSRFGATISSGATNVPTGLSNVVAVAAGNFHCLALRSNGTLVAWGDNYYGQTTVRLA